MQGIRHITLSAIIILATLPLSGCGSTSLPKLAPYIEQSGRAVLMAIEDYRAAGLLTEARYTEVKAAVDPFAKNTVEIAAYLRTLTTIDAATKDEALRKIGEGVALGRRVGLSAGLPPESVVARVLLAAVIGLETTASTIQAVNTPAASFALGAESKTVDAESVKVKLPEIDKDLRKYFRK